MNKGKIISEALLLLGSNNAYNDNKTDEYKISNSLLDEVVIEIAGDDDFLFNAITTKLTSTGQNELGENRFNIPIDFHRIIKSKDKCRLEGEFIYSKASELFLQYGRTIPINEFPEYTKKLLVLALAKKLSITFNSYNDRYNILANEYEIEKTNVIYKTGFLYNPWEE